jgi:hypothetical protein
MIRLALPADKVQVILLLKAARASAEFDRTDGVTGFMFPFDPAYAERLFLQHLEPSRLCLVLVDRGIVRGVLMAAATDHPFGPVKLARETVWFIEPQFRGRGAVAMLDAFEQWARAQGCAFSGMAGIGADPAVGVLYRRRRYRVAETHYLKAL